MEYALKRLLTAAAAVFVMAAVAVPVARAAIPQGAITWTPDHRARTIGVSVKLEIYPACGADVGTCQVESTMADVIRKQILSIWNQGAHYRCYELIFDVNITLGTNRFGVDDDRVGVRIDQSPVAIRSEVMGVSGLSRQPLSDDPSDKFVPTNDVLRPTTWAFPSSQPNLYAHEFGHVIGLHDTYEDQGDSSVPIPGAPHDLMSTMAANISQETYDRVVKRSGVVKDSDLRCDDDWQLEMQVTGSGFSVSWTGSFGKVPLPPGREGPVQVMGAAHVVGSWTFNTCSMPIDINGNSEIRQGTFVVAFSGDLAITGAASADTTIFPPKERFDLVMTPIEDSFHNDIPPEGCIESLGVAFILVPIAGYPDGIFGPLSIHAEDGATVRSPMLPEALNNELFQQLAGLERVATLHKNESP